MTTWTADPPRKPGWYWCQWFAGGWQVVRVLPRGESGLDVAVAGHAGDWDVADLKCALWAGPIPEPTDPPAGEVST